VHSYLPPSHSMPRSAALAALLVSNAAVVAAMSMAPVRPAPSAFASPTAPAQAAGPVMPRTDERKTCPVPEEGIQHAVELMKEGRLFRYTYPSGEESPVSTVERDLAAYTGHRYCVAVNSGASALYLALRGAGVEPGAKVLCNAFTFGAVPSAIVHAGCEVVYVESKEDYTIDVDDLRRAIAEHPDSAALMLSHMRGRVGDMDAIKTACDEAGVVLLEDCAHSLGVLYDGAHTGHHGLACGVSSQAFKMLNSGEGGFVLTDDDEVAMRAAVLAGAYEANTAKHVAIPPMDERFRDLPVELPNLSLRMSALAAAALVPQVGNLEERIAEYTLRYEELKQRLRTTPAASRALVVPDDHERVRPVHDELLFTIDADVLAETAARSHGGDEDAAVAAFQRACEARGLLMNLFGSATNARNFANWRFAPTGSSKDPLPLTKSLIKRSFGIRLPLQWEREDIFAVADVLEWVAAEHFGA